jgi:hypothetical protein
MSVTWAYEGSRDMAVMIIPENWALIIKHIFDITINIRGPYLSDSSEKSELIYKLFFQQNIVKK